MNRRSFLAMGSAAVAAGLAGCGVDTSDAEEPEWTTVTEAVGDSGGSEQIGGSEQTRVIEDVEGLDGSRVFEGVEFTDARDGIDVFVTREATLELGVTVVEYGWLCGEDDEFPRSMEWELQRGERSAFLVLPSCSKEFLEIDVAAVGPANRVVDSLVLYLGFSQ